MRASSVVNCQLILGLKLISSSLPRGHLAPRDVDVVDAPVEALLDHHIEFDLGRDV